MSVQSRVAEVCLLAPVAFEFSPLGDFLRSTSGPFGLPVGSRPGHARSLVLDSRVLLGTWVTLSFSGILVCEAYG